MGAPVVPIPEYSMPPKKTAKNTQPPPPDATDDPQETWGLTTYGKFLVIGFGLAIALCLGAYKVGLAYDNGYAAGRLSLLMQDCAEACVKRYRDFTAGMAIDVRQVNGEDQCWCVFEQTEDNFRLRNEHRTSSTLMPFYP